QQAGQFASTFGADLQKLPHFDKVKGELRERLAKVELPADAPPAAVEAAALRLYTQLLSEKVLPALTNETEAGLLDNLQRKAAASTSVNPGSAAPSTARQYTSFADLPADAWK